MREAGRRAGVLRPHYAQHGVATGAIENVPNGIPHLRLLQDELLAPLLMAIWLEAEEAEASRAQPPSDAPFAAPSAALFARLALAAQAT